jgi:hypothetical protein
MNRLLVRCHRADSVWRQSMSQLNTYFQDWSSFFHFIANRDVHATGDEAKLKPLRIPYLGSTTIQSAVNELESVTHFRSIRLKLKAFVKCRTIITTGKFVRGFMFARTFSLIVVNVI